MGLPSFCYRAILSFRSYLYKKGIRKTSTLPARVISVGNITLGGTGKTPLVIALAQEAGRRHFQPCILTRGYRGKGKEPCLSTDDRGIFSDARCVGDEAALMAYRLPDTPIVRDRSRFSGGMFALRRIENKGIDVFILDDGYQHWSLSRDMDILLIDATNPFGNGKLFPEGTLREPLDALERADTIIITKSDMIRPEEKREIQTRIEQYNRRAPVFSAHYEPVFCTDPSGRMVGLHSFQKRNVLAFSAIANPSYFESMLTSHEFEIEESIRFRDHHSYSQRDIHNIEKKARGMDIVTTEKDMVKLKELNIPKNVFALRVEFIVEEVCFDHIFKIISKKKSQI